MPSFKLLVFLALVPGLCGCYALSKVDELSTMSNYSKEADAQHKTIKQINASYDALVAAITSGGMKDYPDDKSVRKAFGEPILIQANEVQGELQEQWLYRYALLSKAKDKVYLYFDSQGKLIKYEQEKIQW